MFIKTSFFENKVKAFINVKKEDIPNVSKGEKVKKIPFEKVNFIGKSKLCSLTNFQILFDKLQ